MQPKKITDWIASINDLHRKKPPPNVKYTRGMPDIQTLMQGGAIESCFCAADLFPSLLSSLARGGRRVHSRRGSAQRRAGPGRQRLWPCLLRHAGYPRPPIPQGVTARVLHPVGCPSFLLSPPLTARCPGFWSSKRHRIFKRAATTSSQRCAPEAGVLGQSSMAAVGNMACACCSKLALHPDSSFCQFTVVSCGEMWPRAPLFQTLGQPILILIFGLLLV